MRIEGENPQRRARDMVGVPQAIFVEALIFGSKLQAVLTRF